MARFHGEEVIIIGQQKARDAKPDAPALHFLLGFQYAYTGHPDRAVRELDKTIELEPQDRMASALRDLIGGKTSGPPA